MGNGESNSMKGRLTNRVFFPHFDTSKTSKGTFFLSHCDTYLKAYSYKQPTKAIVLCSAINTGEELYNIVLYINTTIE